VDRSSNTLDSTILNIFWTLMECEAEVKMRGACDREKSTNKDILKEELEDRITTYSRHNDPYPSHSHSTHAATHTITITCTHTHSHNHHHTPSPSHTITHTITTTHLHRFGILPRELVDVFLLLRRQSGKDVVFRAHQKCVRRLVKYNTA
jgi:hypothetical protein